MGDDVSGGRAFEPAERRDVPLGQVVFDNIWLWFLLGVGIPFLLYTVWGLMDIASTPPLPQPGP